MKVDVNKISINIDQQSTLARLLAQENIHVIHGNYRTAWFDPEKRTLALPIWKNRGKAVYDLLTGHEVGHALYTPAKGWHEAVDDIEGAPKAYLNVLEDVRIERKVQDKYPGLRLQFKKAYKVLLDEDFFGLSQLGGNYNNMLLIDRINVKYKLGELIDVKFNDSAERDFYLRAYKTQTFEDVVELAKEIYAYQKKLMQDMQPQLQQNQQMSITPEEGNGEEDDSSYDDYNKDKPEENKSEELSESAKPSSEQAEADEVSNGQVEQKPDHVAKEELKATEGIKESTLKERNVDDSYEALQSMTDKAFREKEKELTAGDELKDTMIYTINTPRKPVKDVVIVYKEYYSHWKEKLQQYNAEYEGIIDNRASELEADFKKFKLQTEQAAGYMAKEFELRKAAFQYSRASQQKTGIINTNKLHTYKFSEDIFLKSTKLANYKNHGMMMFIDFSGSMSHNMGATIRQLLNLTSFCRMINIPYEVYAFTTRVRADDDTYAEDKRNWLQYTDCEVVLQNFNLLNLSSSKMTRTEYNESFKMLWTLSQCWDNNMTNLYITEWNQLHSTPLNSTIVYANEMIKQFKAQHRIEKMTTMFLTDGESDSFQARITDEGSEHRATNGYRYYKSLVRFGGHTLDIGGSINSHKVTEKMLETIKKTTGTTVLGFFVSQYRNEAVSRVCNETSYMNKTKYADQMNKNRAIIEDNILGYDRYFGLCQKYMDVVENEFGEMVEDGATKNKLKSAFAKMTKAKRVNRILLNAFVDSIA